MKRTIQNISLKDEELYFEIVKGDDNALRSLMEKYTTPLCHYACYFTKSKDLAEEVVADVFINLWKIRFTLNVKSNLKTYLYTACRNRSIDLLAKEKPHLSDSLDASSLLIGGKYADEDLNVSELNLRLNAIVEKMPTKRQMVFRMSRVDGLKYSEIAEILSISINTVQNHMVEAVKFVASHKSKII